MFTQCCCILVFVEVVHFFICSEGSIPTDLEQATGLEKKELDAHIAGIEVQY